MAIIGKMFIGGRRVRGEMEVFHSLDPSTGAKLQPAFGGATAADVQEACVQADQSAAAYGGGSLVRRAVFLDAIARNLGHRAEELIVRCMTESALTRTRLEGELNRTIGQLRMFADLVREGGFQGVRIDHAQPERAPVPRPDLRLYNRPLGVVAVFAASNFPLAFSVAGGDTASALAAGCPVIVKAHSAHPGTSELAASAIDDAARECDMPAGVFSMLFDSGIEAGRSLAADYRIKAVAFTGSRQAGLALMRIAEARREPIPVFAEMSSINPIIILPHALASRPLQIAEQFVTSLTLGAGQFCTNPGLILALAGESLDRFLEAASKILSGAPAATLLSARTQHAYTARITAVAKHPKVAALGYGRPGHGTQVQAALFATSAEDFIGFPELGEEIFGPAAMLVRCSDLHELSNVIANMEGQLTAALIIDEPDHEMARRLLPLLERKVGRILANGFGTGVEVVHAMMHGGPYPATSDGRSTSVGSLSIARFLRPVCYQNLPEELLPSALRDGNLIAIPRLVDGRPLQAQVQLNEPVTID